MAARAGRDWVLQIFNGASYVTVAGLRTRSFKAGSEMVDVTTADSSGRWRELLASASVQTLEIDAAGIYQNDATAKLLLTAAAAATLQTMRLTTPGLQMDGLFLVDDFNAGGNYNEGMTFDVKLQSAGAITITQTST